MRRALMRTSITGSGARRAARRCCCSAARGPQSPGRDESIAVMHASIEQWAKRNDLVAIEASYAAKTRDAHTLRFTDAAAAEDDDERRWRRHWAPATLDAKKTAKLREKLEKAPDI